MSLSLPYCLLSEIWQKYAGLKLQNRFQIEISMNGYLCLYYKTLFIEWQEKTILFCQKKSVPFLFPVMYNSLIPKKGEALTYAL